MLSGFCRISLGTVRRADPVSLLIKEPRNHPVTRCYLAEVFITVFDQIADKH